MSWDYLTINYIQSSILFSYWRKYEECIKMGKQFSEFLTSEFPFRENQLKWRLRHSMVLSINLLTFSKNESLLIEDQIGRLIYLSIFNLLFIEQLFIKILEFMQKKTLLRNSFRQRGESLHHCVNIGSRFSLLKSSRKVSFIINQIKRNVVTKLTSQFWAPKQQQFQQSLFLYLSLSFSLSLFPFKLAKVWRRRRRG